MLLHQIYYEFYSINLENKCHSLLVHLLYKFEKYSNNHDLFIEIIKWFRTLILILFYFLFFMNYCCVCFNHDLLIFFFFFIVLYHCVFFFWGQNEELDCDMRTSHGLTILVVLFSSRHI